FLVAGNVLRRDSLGPLGEGFVVAQLFFRGEFAVGMGVEVSAVAVQGEHQKGFGVETRRGNFVRSEIVDGGLEGLLQKHPFISSQRHRDTEKIKDLSAVWLGRAHLGTAASAVRPSDSSASCPARTPGYSRRKPCRAWLALDGRGRPSPRGWWCFTRPLSFPVSASLPGSA